MIKKFNKGKKGLISKNFKWSDFDCHCKRNECKTTLVDTDLVDKLQEIRDDLQIPIVVVSGYRCAYHNEKVGGKIGSFHLIGKAADISSPQMTHPRLQTFLESFDGLGKGKNITHVDVRGYKARWVYK